MDEMREENEVSEDETKVEIVYWATGRSKIYLEKNFERRYAEIKARSEQKRKDKDKDKDKDKVNVGLKEETKEIANKH